MPTPPLHWYEKLNAYFPVEEMKSRAHMEALLRERADVYRKEEGPHHVLMVAEFDDFLFVDYLLVAREARGQGLGRRLLDGLKARGKPILLEVEPLDYADTDTVKRQRFYAREGFRAAEAIAYRRRSLATGERVELEILYWAPSPETTEADVFAHLRAMYDEVHTYDDRRFYGAAYEPADEALSLAA